MKKINLGQLTSLSHCEKCGCPNEITPIQENFICKACGENNNLKILCGIDLVGDCKEKNIDMKDANEACDAQPNCNICVIAYGSDFENNDFVPCNFIRKKYGESIWDYK